MLPVSLNLLGKFVETVSFLVSVYFVSPCKYRQIISSSDSLQKSPGGPKIVPGTEGWLL